MFLKLHDGIRNRIRTEALEFKEETKNEKWHLYMNHDGEDEMCFEKEFKNWKIRIEFLEGKFNTFDLIQARFNRISF